MIDLTTDKNYYGLVSGLHDLVAGKKSNLSPQTFRQHLSAQLAPRDYYQLMLTSYSYDNQNFLSLYFNLGNFNPNGNLKEEELSFILNNKFSEDVYFAEFLDLVDIEAEGITPFELEQKLTQHYFDFVGEYGNEFLRNWSEFELTLKNLSAVYSLRNLDMESESQYLKGGYFSGLELKRINIADLDAQYPYLKRKYEALEIDDPIQRKLKVDHVKWDYLEENSFFHYFTIEKIIAYAIKLQDLEVWKKIDENKGEELLKEFINKINKELETLIQ